MLDKIKEFFPSSWSIDNKTSIYILTIIITMAGVLSYQNLPKEQFPDVVFPQIMVNTLYPGTSPSDMESLVTKQIEKQVKGIAGVKKVTSNSIQNFSMVNVEFGTNVDVAQAKQKVKDAVDKAKSDLPTDLPKEPDVIDIDISQVPIMNINISGDYDLDRLKKYADDVKDKIEGMKEITRVDMVGALDREIQINVDMYKAALANITMSDIEMAVKYENMTIPGGQVDMGNMKRSISITGDFKQVNEIENIVIRGGTGAVAYLKDIAEVKDAFKEKESYARMDGKNVITLNVIKRTGANLINAADNIRKTLDEMKSTSSLKDLKISITGDQSSKTRVTLHDLINTIIIGFILVTLILMFFMGTTNAIFVAASVPISMCIAFLVMPSIGFTLNFVVLFGFLLALGIVVDDAIVVIENTHRINHENPKLGIVKSAKLAAGEVFIPVLSGTLTTLAPFFPLAFWQGVIGKFMYFMPVTMIVTLTASLLVAYIINPVFAVDFMDDVDHEEGEHVVVKKKTFSRGFLVTSILFAVIALLSHLKGNHFLGNFAIFIYLFFLLNKFVLNGIIKKFQERTWPAVQDKYASFLSWCMEGKRPYGVLGSIIGLLILSFVLVGVFSPKVIFFPSGDPNYVYTYIELPIGTHQNYTDSITRVVENRIKGVIGDNNPLVESMISNVAVGAGDASSFDFSAASHKGKVTVAFVEFAHRHGESTKPYLTKIRETVKDIPGAKVVVDQEHGGPPTGKPISIEIYGDDFKTLSNGANELIRYLNNQNISGVEELKSDLVLNKPDAAVRIDRERARREGISTAQIGGQINNAVFGKEVSKFKDGNDDYPIMLRYRSEQRNNLNILMNAPISFRDMNMGGMMRSVPISSVADIDYGNTVGGIKRKNEERVVTVASNVLTDYNPNEVVEKIKNAVNDFPKHEGIRIKFGGEQEDQAETMGFLGGAMLTSILLIILILVIQFNSISKPIIILSEIIFSVTGVLLGFVIFGMDISIIMTGIGIIALAGIVVRNGILLVEFTDILLERGMGLKEAIVEAGRTRMTPVLLTASATTLGLIPLAVGLNIDFYTLFSELNPHLFFGGDSVAFWGPLSWTMIFGLIFATFLTLIVVPAMLMIAGRLKPKVTNGFRKLVGLDE
ncbi:MAG: efflux RND transporter permease subunit [Saprospiraceae bacterium]|nr:efflux RND transporter permease subunit [Saprospiraceae bacterium]